MTPRWPDGSTVAEDPRVAAARLDAVTLGWRIWFGDKTGRFWAVQVGARVLVEAKTTGALMGEIAARTPATRSPTASPARAPTGVPRSTFDVSPVSPQSRTRNP